MTEAPATHRLTDEQEDQLKRLVAILIATVTIIAALAAFLQTDAGGRANQANRDAQRYAIQALGLRAAGQSEVDYGWYGATHSWYMLDTFARSADAADDPAAAERYRSVRDRITELSPLLAEPYFDPESGFYPDRYGYEADVFLVAATELSERYAISAQLNNIWNDKANTYIVHLTLLAVALALYGLSTTLEDWTRWLFIGVGTMLALVTLVWIALTVVRPVDVLGIDAVQAYSRGFGLAWRGETEEAIAAFDEALALEPGYANAAYERGNAYIELAYVDLGLNPEAAQESLRAAARDYEAARNAGRDDSSVNWNLGWTNYLLGFFEESAEASRRSLELDPNLFAVRCNLGVTLLADGQIEAARAEYAEAVRLVTQRVTQARQTGEEPPSSLWSLLDACANDVESMALRLDDQGKWWTQAPPRQLIADTPEVRAEAQRLITEIKSMIVALENTGSPPGERPVANVSPFEFAIEVYDDTGAFDHYEKMSAFPQDTKKIVVLYDYQGIQRGQTEVWKVYRNGAEDASLRVVADWNLDESGSAAKPLSYAYSSVFVFADGEYTVELYIDNHLIQRGTFTIGP